MRQCELEKVEFEKRGKLAKRTGHKLVTFLAISPDMKGAIIELKKETGLWVVDVIHERDVESHEIKRNWHVGGL